MGAWGSYSTTFVFFFFFFFLITDMEREKSSLNTCKMLSFRDRN